MLSRWEFWSVVSWLSGRCWSLNKGYKWSATTLARDRQRVLKFWSLPWLDRIYQARLSVKFWRFESDLNFDLNRVKVTSTDRRFPIATFLYWLLYLGDSRSQGSVVFVGKFVYGCCSSCFEERIFAFLSVFSHFLSIFWEWFSRETGGLGGLSWDLRLSREKRLRFMPKSCLEWGSPIEIN